MKEKLGSIAANGWALHRWGISIPSARYKSPIELLKPRYNKMLNRNRPAETEAEKSYEAWMLLVNPTFAKPFVNGSAAKPNQDAFNEKF